MFTCCSSKYVEELTYRYALYERVASEALMTDTACRMVATGALGTQSTDVSQRTRVDAVLV